MKSDNYSEMVNRGEIFAMEIQGNDLAPIVKQGDVLHVAKSLVPSPGDLAVFSLKGVNHAKIITGPITAADGHFLGVVFQQSRTWLKEVPYAN